MSYYAFGVGDAAADQTACTNYGGTYTNGFCTLSVAQAQTQCVTSSTPGVWNSQNNTCTNGGVVYTMGQLQCAAGNGVWTAATNTCTNSSGQSMVMAPATPTATTPANNNTLIAVGIGGLALLGVVVFLAEEGKGKKARR